MSASLRLIVGLGNPGSEHLRTRHNAGFWFVDALAQGDAARFGIESKLRGETAKVVIDNAQVWLLKPITFMNASGASVGAALRYWKIEPEEMLVVHDDLDLPPGAARLKFDGGHGGQNGLRDLFAHIGHGRFATCTMSGCSKQRTTCVIASTSRMCARNLLPSPSPFDAPATRPAMSTNSIEVGMIFSGLAIADSAARRGSGTGTTPTFGSIVQNGKFAAAMPALVSALKRVDLPTFGRPTMPHLMPMTRNSVIGDS